MLQRDTDDVIEPISDSGSDSVDRDGLLCFPYLITSLFAILRKAS